MLIRKIFNWQHSAKIRISLLGLIFSLLLLGGYVSDIHGLFKKWSALQQQETTINYTLKQTRQLLQHISNEQPTLSVARFGNNFEFTTLLDALAKLAKITQIDIQVLKPGIMQYKNNLAIYPLDLIAFGNYKNLVAFSAAIAQLNMLVIMPTYKIYTDNNNLVLAATILAYKNTQYPQTLTNLKPTAYPAKIAITRDPFLHLDNAYLQQNFDLSQWDNSSLSFVGMISENHTNVAIIEDPLGLIYHIAVGEKIGLKQTRVKKITAAAIVTDDATQNIYWRN